MMPTVYDPGSFRDREGRVFTHQGRVFRALSSTAATAWTQLSQTSFFPRLVAEGKVVATRSTELSATELAELTGGEENWAIALEHDVIPFLSYPYEWTFGMLRDAALLQLELLRAALGEGMILKDASSYNVQWRGAQPVFIDIASFEPWRQGDPWVGYLQFCQLFLYPLLLTAHRDIPFQSWLRGGIDGITPEVCNQIFSWRDRFKPGVFSHVYLQAKLHARTANTTNQLRSDIKRIGFSKELILRNVQGLEKLVRRLEWQRRSSEWASYADDNTYDDESRSSKERFIATAAATRRWKLVWDLGANTGSFSRIAAEHAEQVIAFDADHLAVERLYQQLARGGPPNILPLVANLADPSPPLGWRHRERKALTERALPELTLCLALVHHMVISANIPLAEFVDWLASLGSHLVIEFVDKNDAMVRKLLQNKDDIYDDYELGKFESYLARHYEILSKETLGSGERTLYFAAPRHR